MDRNCSINGCRNKACLFLRCENCSSKFCSLHKQAHSCSDNRRKNIEAKQYIIPSNLNLRDRALQNIIRRVTVKMVEIRKDLLDRIYCLNDCYNKLCVELTKNFQDFQSNPRKTIENFMELDMGPLEKESNKFILYFKNIVKDLGENYLDIQRQEKYENNRSNAETLIKKFNENLSIGRGKKQAINAAFQSIHLFLNNRINIINSKYQIRENDASKFNIKAANFKYCRISFFDMQITILLAIIDSIRVFRNSSHLKKFKETVENFTNLIPIAYYGLFRNNNTIFDEESLRNISEFKLETQTYALVCGIYIAGHDGHMEFYPSPDAGFNIFIESYSNFHKIFIPKKKNLKVIHNFIQTN